MQVVEEDVEILHLVLVEQVVEEQVNLMLHLMLLQGPLIQVVVVVHIDKI